MKRAALLIVAALLAVAFQIISNCSQPLESSDLAGPLTPTTGSRVDTLFIIDTVLVIHGGHVDTVIVVDTVIDTLTMPDSIIIDTVILPDTTIIDTVVIVEPGDSPVLCDRLSSAQQEIIWLFRNAEGPFHLEFAALPESDHPSHTLTVSIGDQVYLWDLSDSRELIIDPTMPPNAMIMITTSKPPSYGHSIDICMTWTAN